MSAANLNETAKPADYKSSAGISGSLRWINQTSGCADFPRIPSRSCGNLGCSTCLKKEVSCFHQRCMITAHRNHLLKMTIFRLIMSHRFQPHLQLKRSHDCWCLGTLFHTRIVESLNLAFELSRIAIAEGPTREVLSIGCRSSCKAYTWTEVTSNSEVSRGGWAL